MNYPLISEYIEAIKSAEDNFEELSYLRPVLGDDGLPLMTSGNFAVVFKMKDGQNGKFYAVKCFTKEQEGRAEAYREIGKELENVSSPYILSIRYLEKELFVDTDQTAETEFPVLLMDWVEGKTLDKYLRDNLDDKYALEMLAYRFSLLAQWLIPQPFAHGDLKPDNILVREDGTLVLVDYDGMYVPAMKGQKARELGSPDFRHPLRTENDFDEHIDDFPLVSILLSLKAISCDSQLLERFGATDRLLLSQFDYYHNDNDLIQELSNFNEKSLNSIVRVFNHLLFNKDWDNGDILLYVNCEFPSISKYAKELSFVSEEEIRKGLHVTNYDSYSHDRHRLLRVWDLISYSEYDEREIREYFIIPGTSIICASAFVNCGFLEKIDIPSSVQVIGAFAFYGCTFRHLKLKESIQYIDKDAFSGSAIEEIIVPDGILPYFVSIAPNYDSLFVEVSKRSERLSTLVLQEDIDNAWIDEYGVIYSSDKKRLLKCDVTIAKYHVRNGVLAIANNAFKNNSALECIILPDSLLEIGESAFEYCKNLKEINIPPRVSQIRRRTFLCCELLESIDLPSHIFQIGEEAFSYCKSIKRFIIPSQVSDINKNTFSYCKSLIDIKLHGSIKTIGSGAFQECGSLLGIKLPSGISSLAYDLFRGCSSLREITIPDGVKTIDKYCFWNCRSLIKVTLPNSLEDIGETSFSDCTSLETICLPPNLRRIGNGAFGDCISLKEIDLPDSVIAMGYSIFHKCRNLERIKFPRHIKYVSDRVCWECTSLKYVSLPTSAESIGDDSFENCYELETISIPPSVTKLDRGAFEKCYKINSIILPDKLESIGNECFFSCRSLKTLILPISLKTIGHNVFAGSGVVSIESKSPYFESDGKALYTTGKEKLIEYYSNDKSFVVPQSVRTIGTWSFNGAPIISIIMKGNVETIEDYAFIGCHLLEDIVLPTSLKEIANDAFSKCTSLKQLHIPEGVTKLGYRVFEKCKSLRVVSLPKTIWYIGSYAFDECENLQAIIVPYGSVANFKKILDNCIYSNYKYKKLLVAQ